MLITKCSLLLSVSLALWNVVCYCDVILGLVQGSQTLLLHFQLTTLLIAWRQSILVAASSKPCSQKQKADNGNKTLRFTHLSLFRSEHFAFEQFHSRFWADRVDSLESGKLWPEKNKCAKRTWLSAVQQIVESRSELSVAVESERAWSFCEIQPRRHEKL